MDFKKVFGIDIKVTTGDVAKRNLFNINADTVDCKKALTFAAFETLKAGMGSLATTVKACELHL
jgi:hypothetical protein